MLKPTAFWLLACFVVGHALWQRLDLIHSQHQPSDPGVWLVEQGFAPVTDITLAGSDILEAQLWRKLETDQQLLTIEQEHFAIAKDWLQSSIPPDIWDSRQIWFANTIRPAQSFRPYMARLQYRLQHGSAPPSPWVIFGLLDPIAKGALQ